MQTEQNDTEESSPCKQFRKFSRATPFDHHHHHDHDDDDLLLLVLQPHTNLHSSSPIRKSTGYT